MKVAVHTAMSVHHLRSIAKTVRDAGPGGSRGSHLRSCEPSGSASSVLPMPVREIAEGQEIDQVLVVRGRRAGREPGRVELSLGDRTGSLAASVPAELAPQPGAVVRVGGRCRGGRLDVVALRPAREDEYELEALLDGPPRSA